MWFFNKTISIPIWYTPISALIFQQKGCFIYWVSNYYVTDKLHDISDFGKSPKLKVAYFCTILCLLWHVKLLFLKYFINCSFTPLSSRVPPAHCVHRGVFGKNFNRMIRRADEISIRTDLWCRITVPPLEGRNYTLMRSIWLNTWPVQGVPLPFAQCVLG